jgi:hypothetical protein
VALANISISFHADLGGVGSLVTQNRFKMFGNRLLRLQKCPMTAYPAFLPTINRCPKAFWSPGFGVGEQLNFKYPVSARVRCYMTVSRPGESLSEIDLTLQQHQEWFCQMPWATSSGQSTTILLDTMRAWIDEYSSEFQEASEPLSASVSLGPCCHRILNLLSGPCLTFLQGVTSRSVAYQKIAKLLQDASETSTGDNSFDDVRNVFREFGRNDGVRHCVLASAVEAGHERAIEVFGTEFEGVRRQLAASFSDRLGEEGVNEIWHDVFTDLVYGEGATS